MGKKGKAGGKPKGRAGQKQKAQRQQSSAWESALDMDDDSPRMFKGFTQRGAGPVNSFSPRTPTVRLRHQAIAFVSATPGTSTPAEQVMDDSEIVAAALGEGDDDEDDDDYMEEDEGEGEGERIDESAIQTNIMDTDMGISEAAMAHMNLQSSADVADHTMANTSDVEIIIEKKAEMRPARAEESLPFFVDTVGDARLNGRHKANGKKPVVRAPSPSPSDSSEEVVFHGRSKPAGVRTPAKRLSPNKPSTPQPQIQTPHVTDGLLAALEAPSAQNAKTPSEALGWAAKPPKWDAQIKPQDEWKPAPAQPYWRKSQARNDLDPSPAETRAIESLPTREAKVMSVAPNAADKEKGAEDTIASLQAAWKHDLKSKKLAKGTDRTLNGSFDDVDSKATSKRRRKRGRKKSNRELRESLDTDDEDEEDDAAEQDYLANLMAQLEAEDPSGNIKAVLASGNVLTPGEAVSGPSMVVDGRAYGDDEVLTKQTSDEWEDEDSSDSELIGQDLSELSDNDDRPIDPSDLESTDLEDALEYTEREQWEDEEDLRQRRIEGMTDEKYARLLAKQLELGIDDDDLIIDDGEVEDPHAFGDLDEARLRFEDITNSSFARSTNKNGMRRRRRAKGDTNFPDASALADTVEQYGENGFDIMDFERPSLRPLKKGRKGKLPAELEAVSDEELRDTLNGQWERDRLTKRQKKAEREELRAQGLLGSSGKKGKADLSQKYLQGMTTKQVHDELRIFLQDDGQQSRPFPPMSKDDRKALHHVADALDLKSKSVGSGKNRFPVLYKTSFTLEYDEYTFNRIITNSTRGFYKNAAFKGGSGKKAMKRAAGASRPGAGGGFSKSAVEVRHGEVVGANAKEIGADSFGHKMMEKMGWTKGMALGKDGEGLLVPVAQVMRSGKAGLG